MATKILYDCATRTGDYFSEMVIPSTRWLTLLGKKAKFFSHYKTNIYMTHGVLNIYIYGKLNLKQNGFI